MHALRYCVMTILKVQWNPDDVNCGQLIPPTCEKCWAYSTQTPRYGGQLVFRAFTSVTRLQTLVQPALQSRAHKSFQDSFHGLHESAVWSFYLSNNNNYYRLPKMFRKFGSCVRVAAPDGCAARRSKFQNKIWKSNFALRLPNLQTFMTRKVGYGVVWVLY